MTIAKHTKLTFALLSIGLCAGLAAFMGVSPDASATELLQGRYRVSNAFSEAIPAPLFVRVQASNGEQIGSETLRCILPNAQLSQHAYCPALDLLLDVNVYQPGEYVSVIEVDFLELEVWAVAHNLDVVAIDPIEPYVGAAEAEWVGLPDGWVCNISEADQALCNQACGVGGGDVSADPWPSQSNNPYFEPACEVSCDCRNSDDEHEWKDFPEVVPAS